MDEDPAGLTGMQGKRRSSGGSGGRLGVSGAALYAIAVAMGVVVVVVVAMVGRRDGLVSVARRGGSCDNAWHMGCGAIISEHESSQDASSCSGGSGLWLGSNSERNEATSLCLRGSDEKECCGSTTRNPWNVDEGTGSEQMVLS
jgi:hypothetical protein